MDGGSGFDNQRDAQDQPAVNSTAEAVTPQTTAVAKNEVTATPDPDKNLDRDTLIAEGQRLWQRTFEVLEDIPEYQKEAMRWVREAKNSAGVKTLRFKYGGKLLEVMISRGPWSVDQKDILAVHVHPGTANVTEGGYIDEQRERSLSLLIPTSRVERPVISYTLPPGEEPVPENKPKTVAKIEELINEIRTGFPEPSAPPSPATPPTG